MMEKEVIITAMKSSISETLEKMFFKPWNSRNCRPGRD